jgi:parallel beta-helix repeat protein
LETRQVLSSPASSHAIVIEPGHSIQQAVNAAAPGTVIYIEPGIYKQSVSVSTPHLSLIGLTGANGSRAVIENPGDVDTGITVASNGSSPLKRFTLENIVVRDFAENGVLLSGVDHFVLSQVEADANGEYGIFPVFSAHGLITECTASGSNDTGIYVGQSNHVAIESDVAFDNVNGIEIENSTEIRATRNHVYGNTVGILLDLLPGLTIEVTSHNRITENTVRDNNRPNTAAAGDLTALEPSGIGILLVGGDHTQVKENVVTGNGYAGIVLLSGLDLITLANLPPNVYGNINPNPEHTLIAHNVVVGNGHLFSYTAFPPGADLIWDSSGTHNRWDDNTFDTSFPSRLP